jgi:DNA-binding protein YbaB
MLEQAFNKAIENANSVNEGEMKNTAAGMLPGLGI